jgi:hypothetical protein
MMSVMCDVSPAVVALDWGVACEGDKTNRQGLALFDAPSNAAVTMRRSVCSDHGLDKQRAVPKDCWLQSATTLPAATACNRRRDALCRSRDWGC